MISEEQKLIRIYFQGNSSFYDGRKEEDCPFYNGREKQLGNGLINYF